ncbi:hypothetical protein RIF29_18372 [Crotalaria pallida]|uniref:tRNA-binding domain-containing protein n=1 Tax=Crotalaria pallida TaxID=3830 RepID=A0AAN9FL46_CROPI
MLKKKKNSNMPALIPICRRDVEKEEEFQEEVFRCDRTVQKLEGAQFSSQQPPSGNRVLKLEERNGTPKENGGIFLAVDFREARHLPLKKSFYCHSTFSIPVRQYRNCSAGKALLLRTHHHRLIAINWLNCFHFHFHFISFSFSFRTTHAAVRLSLSLNRTHFPSSSRSAHSIKHHRKKKSSVKSSNEAKNKAVAEPEITITRLDIRVGLVKKAEKHPGADFMYVEQIDVGEEQPRTVVSGLVKYIPLDEMQNRKVCVVCNLKPAALKGIKSQAMVLAASNDDHSKVELVEPPAAAIVGERVTFPGYEGNPNELLNPKKKIFETLQVDLHSNEELVACYKDVPLTTSAGVCKVSSICGGSIK